jgi:hypothetical protein
VSWSNIKKQCKPLNNKDDADYASGCMRKKRFPSKAEADKVAAIMRKRHNKDFNGYNCRFGSHAHVGSLNEGVVNLPR